MARLHVWHRGDRGLREVALDFFARDAGDISFTSQRLRKRGYGVEARPRE
jgi:hypothetical protein